MLFFYKKKNLSIYTEHHTNPRYFHPAHWNIVCGLAPLCILPSSSHSSSSVFPDHIASTSYPKSSSCFSFSFRLSSPFFLTSRNHQHTHFNFHSVPSLHRVISPFFFPLTENQNTISVRLSGCIPRTLIPPPPYHARLIPRRRGPRRPRTLILPQFSLYLPLL